MKNLLGSLLSWFSPKSQLPSHLDLMRREWLDRNLLFNREIAPIHRTAYSLILEARQQGFEVLSISLPASAIAKIVDYEFASGKRSFDPLYLFGLPCVDIPPFDARVFSCDGYSVYCKNIDSEFYE